MLLFLLYILQLFLSPKEGWKDLADRNPDPDVLLKRGVYPLLGIAALSEFMGLVYHRAGLMEVIVSAIAVAGAYFLAIFFSRLIFEFVLPKISKDSPDRRRAMTLIACSTGMMLIFSIFDNCLPWNLIVLKFLPVYVVLVIAKAFDYMNLRHIYDMRFLLVASASLVALPLAIYYLIYLLVQ